VCPGKGRNYAIPKRTGKVAFIYPKNYTGTEGKKDEIL
jgi:hypothetical protein